MKKKALYLASLIICLLAVICIGNTTCTAANTVKVTTIKITNIDYSNYYTMRVSGILTIKTLISPTNATNKNITWSSSDKTVAKVNDKGVVTGVNRGLCKITGITKDGSNKKVSFYIRVHSEKEFIYSYEWGYDMGEYGCSLALTSTGEYTMYDISAGNEIESGLYDLDTIDKTITFYRYNDSNKRVWDYTIVSRSKLILSNGTTQVTYTRNYKSKGITCTSKGLLYRSNGPNGEIAITGYKGIDTTITIPSTINNRKVNSVGGMSGNTEIEQVIIPESVISIGSFANCTNLKEITIPDRVRYLDIFAFENCSSLETVQLPDNLDSIFQGTFKGCTSLKSVELPVQLVSVNREAFWDCTNLEKLYFSEGIKNIDYDILKGCNQVDIYGYKGTCAEDFAKANNLKFIER